MNFTYNKILFLIIAFLLGFFTARAIPSSVIISPTHSDADSTVSLMLDFGNGEVLTFTDIPFTEKMSVSDVLLQLNESDTIAVEYDDYGTDIGILINSINGRVNGDRQKFYWQYWVNNRYALVGASSYLIKPNDVIEWKYTQQKIN